MRAQTFLFRGGCVCAVAGPVNSTLTSVLVGESSPKSLARAPIAIAAAAEHLLSATGLRGVDGLKMAVQCGADVGMQWNTPQALHPPQQTHHLYPYQNNDQ